MEITVEPHEEKGFEVGSFYYLPDYPQKLYLAVNGWDGQGNAEVVVVSLDDFESYMASSRSRSAFRKLEGKSRVEVLV